MKLELYRRKITQGSFKILCLDCQKLFKPPRPRPQSVKKEEKKRFVLKEPTPICHGIPFGTHSFYIL